MNKEQIISAVTSKPAIGIFTGIVGLAVGGAGGYFFAQKRILSNFDEAVQAEIAESKQFLEDFYARKHKGPGYSTPQEAAATLNVPIDEVAQDPPKESENALLREAVNAMTDYAGISASSSDPGAGHLMSRPFEHIKLRSVSVEAGGTGSIELVDSEANEVIRSNVFEDGSPTTGDEDDDDDEEPLTDEQLFEADLEVAKSAGTQPYVITYDEFMAAEPGYEQPTLTYFPDDDILLDDHDQIISDIDGTVGEESLRRFGWKSKNNDVVYVRNPRVELDFEITRSRDSYANVVGGFRHSSDTRVQRKFRRGDDE